MKVIKCFKIHNFWIKFKKFQNLGVRVENENLKSRLKLKDENIRDLLNAVEKSKNDLIKTKTEVKNDFFFFQSSYYIYLFILNRTHTVLITTFK